MGVPQLISVTLGINPPKKITSFGPQIKAERVRSERTSREGFIVRFLFIVALEWLRVWRLTLPILRPNDLGQLQKETFGPEMTKAHFNIRFLLHIWAVRKVSLV